MKTMSLVLGIAGAFFLLLSGCGQSESSGASDKTPSLPTVTVAKADSVRGDATKDLIGDVEAVQTVQIRPRERGHVKKICFLKATNINKGDLLFEIESATDQAKADSPNETKLNKSDPHDSQYTRIYAPIAGQVGRPRVAEGDYVSPAMDPLTDIMQIDPIYIRIHLSECEYQNSLQKTDSPIFSLLNADLKVRLAKNKIYTAPWHLAAIDNKINSSTGTLALWIKIENAKGILLPGDCVAVSITEHHNKALPSTKVSAILNDAKSAYVYLLGKGNTALRRDIKLGDVVGDRQIVTEGLSFGETVIIDNLSKVIPGMPVNPVTL